MNEKLEKLNRELAQGEARLRRAQHEQKMLEYQVKQLTRKERTHRLCTRGAMLESFLIRPEVLTDDDVMDILKQAFSQTGMKEVVAERVKGRVAGEPLTEQGRNYTPVEPVRCALPGASCGKRINSSTPAAASNHYRGRYASPALAAPATPLWTCRLETPCAANCSRPASFTEASYIFLDE